jgi:Domain of unknown function (DUF397)
VDSEDPKPAWRRSPFCGTGGCVEVAKVDGAYLIRDGKNPDGPELTFDAVEWAAFRAGVTAGAFD